MITILKKHLLKKLAEAAALAFATSMAMGLADKIVIPYIDKSIKRNRGKRK